MTITFDLVKERVVNAKAIAWDNCHKIYLLMDNEQVELMRTYGYDPLITSDQMSPDKMFETLQEWFKDSCWLRFIQAISTNAGFESLIDQDLDFEEVE